MLLPQRKITAWFATTRASSCAGYKTSVLISITTARSVRRPIRVLPFLTVYFFSQLSIVVEFIAGKTTQTIDRLIALYRPDSIVVGTRGTRGMMQAWGAAFGAPGMGSVSKYCLSHSPVPIIVVRPESKVRKTIEKRRADPKRGKHFDECVFSYPTRRVDCWLNHTFPS